MSESDCLFEASSLINYDKLENMNDHKEMIKNEDMNVEEEIVKNEKQYDYYDLDYESEEVKQDFRRTLCTDSSFLKRFGPLNPNVPKNGYIKPCLQTPGRKCAMTTCKCNNFDFDDLQLIINDSDECYTCKKPISNKRFAFRIPYRDGGFSNTYFCGKYCAHDHFAFDSEAPEHHLIEIMSMYLDRFPLDEKAEIDEDELIDRFFEERSNFNENEDFSEQHNFNRDFTEEERIELFQVEEYENDECESSDGQENGKFIF